MHNLIQEDAPVITAVTHTDEPSIKARVLCLVDGFAAEITHVVDTKHQEYNRHHISVFDYGRMDWIAVLRWGFDEVGHVPIHPDTETIGYLSGLSEVMWAQANVIVNQSRLRQQEIEVQHYADERIEARLQMDAYETALTARRDAAGEDYPAVENGELITPESLDDLRTQVTGVE
jgi:hypothetical protein